MKTLAKEDQDFDRALSDPIYRCERIGELQSRRKTFLRFIVIHMVVVVACIVFGKTSTVAIGVPLLLFAALLSLSCAMKAERDLRLLLVASKVPAPTAQPSA